MIALGIEESESSDWMAGTHFLLYMFFFVKMNPICVELERDVSVTHDKMRLNKVMHPP